jgi:hypothetical protein
MKDKNYKNQHLKVFTSLKIWTFSTPGIFCDEPISKNLSYQQANGASDLFSVFYLLTGMTFTCLQLQSFVLLVPDKQSLPSRVLSLNS